MSSLEILKFMKCQEFEGRRFESYLLGDAISQPFSAKTELFLHNSRHEKNIETAHCF
jgi:hypothetical protein